MSILTLFVVIPVLMLFGLWLARNIRQVRGVMVAGSTALLALSVWLTIAFIQMRQAGHTEAMLFMYLSLIHISEPTRLRQLSRMPSSA